MNISVDCLKNCKSHNAPLAGQCSLLIILSGSTCEGELSANISAEREANEGSTRGTTKEATGTVAYFDYLLLEVLL